MKQSHNKKEENSDAAIGRVPETSVADIVDLEQMRHEETGYRPDLSYFTSEQGVRFAGRHLLIDLYGGERLDDIAHVEATLRAAVAAADATLLHLDLHHFTENSGVSGVAVLAESHMSIHTWPEAAYAALDVFMCGDADPFKAVPVLQEAFRPAKLNVTEHKRGVFE